MDGVHENIEQISMKIINALSSMPANVTPFHRLYCICKYVFKHTIDKHEPGCKIKGVQRPLRYTDQYVMQLNKFNKKEQYKCYRTFGFHLHHKPKYFSTEKSESGIWLSIWTNSKAVLCIPLPLNMTSLFMHFLQED